MRWLQPEEGHSSPGHIGYQNKICLKEGRGLSICPLLVVDDSYFRAAPELVYSIVLMSSGAFGSVGVLRPCLP